MMGTNEILDSLAQRLYKMAKQEYPQARSWSDLDSLCDANEFFMDDDGEILPELTKDGQLDHQTFFTMIDKLDALFKAIRP
tara:strand:+ start:118 stop:360 length:243 start_codon:yes stop_codon:yes gene_type:complete